MRHFQPNNFDTIRKWLRNPKYALQTCQAKDHERWIEIPDSQIMAEVALINAKTIFDLLYEKTGWKKTRVFE